MIDDQIALVAKALSHPARVRIVSLLSDQTECRGYEVFSGLPLAQSTISEHLRVLKAAGLVTSRPMGTAMTYCLHAAVLDEFRDALAKMTAGVAGRTVGKRGC